MSSGWGLLLSCAADAQSLGRLFTTPSLRAELDRQRIRERNGLVDVPEAAPVILDDFQSEPVPPDVVYILDGSMRRSDGSYTIWINNTAYAESDLPENITLLMPYDRGQLRISNPESGESYVVKPGQVLNLTRGELMEAYQYRAQQAAAAAQQTDESIRQTTGASDDSAFTADGTATATGDDSVEPAQTSRDSRQ